MMPPHFNRILVLNLSFRIFWYSKDQYSWLHQSQKGPELAKQLQTNHHNKTMNSFSESVCYASKETHTVQKVFSSVQTYSLKVLGIIEMFFFFCSFWSVASLNLELCHGCHFCPVCSFFLSHEGRPTVWGPLRSPRWFGAVLLGLFLQASSSPLFCFLHLWITSSWED